MLAINNVLLVDDDPISNLINEKIIRISILAKKVGCYLDANEALSYLRKVLKKDRSKFPNLVFLDINMPEMNGWELFEHINKFPKSVLRRCKIFMLTSSIDQEDIAKSKSYDMMCDFISKPLTIEKVKMLFYPKNAPIENLN